MLATGNRGLEAFSVARDVVVDPIVRGMVGVVGVLYLGLKVNSCKHTFIVVVLFSQVQLEKNKYSVTPQPPLV